MEARYRVILGLSMYFSNMKPYSLSWKYSQLKGSAARMRSISLCAAAFERSSISFMSACCVMP